MEKITANFKTVKHFVLTDSQEKIMGIIKISQGESNITKKLSTSILEDTDADTVEFLNSFEMNSITTYLIKARLIDSVNQVDEENYYSLIPTAIY